MREALTHMSYQELTPHKAKLSRKYRTKPFPLYDPIGDLVDGSRATGEGTFHAGQVSAFAPPPSETPAHDRSPSPTMSDEDIDPRIKDISRDMQAASAAESSNKVSKYSHNSAIY